MANNYTIDEQFDLSEIQLDSRTAFSTPDSSYSTLNWPQYSLEQVNNIVGIKVISAIIPFTYYTFNSTNNTFLLTESGGVTNAVVTIPSGNYNSTTFITAVKTALEDVSALTYTITYSSTTGKFTYTNSGGGATTFTFTFGTTGDPGFTNPRNMMGFNAGANVSDTSQSLVAPNAAMIQGDNYIYINSQIGNGIKNYIPLTNTGNGGSATPIVAAADVNVDAGEIINWIDENPQYFFSSEINNLSKIDFYLTLGNNPQKLDLNGQPFKIKLGILTRNTTAQKLQTPLYGNQRVNKRIKFT